MERAAFLDKLASSMGLAVQFSLTTSVRSVGSCRLPSLEKAMTVARVLPPGRPGPGKETMARPLRFIPENTDGVLVEITCRTIGARALMAPSPSPRTFNEVILGVIGRALEVSPLELCGCVFLANHLHALCVVREQQELTRFMQHLGCNLSKEIGGRIRHWQGAFWQRRYDGIVVSDEPEKQWQRLEYLLSNSVKEGLVESPLKWPGVHCAKALIHGERLEGFWWNRTKEWAARRRGLEFGTYDFATRYEVGFAPLPAFRHLSPEEYQDRVAELVRKIEDDGSRARGENIVAGVEKIVGQDPYKAPTRRTKHGVRPRFHVSDREKRNALMEERRFYELRFWTAVNSLRGAAGRAAAAEFPYGCYPPALPFTGNPAPPRPPVPPTRRLVFEGLQVMGRGEIPTIMVPVALLARGQPF